MFGSINANTEKPTEPIVIEKLSEQLELGFAVAGTDLPVQVGLLVGLPEKRLELPIMATLTQNQDMNLYKVKIDVSKIPAAILYYSRELNKPLAVSLILASPGLENLIAPVFDIQLSNISAIEYNAPSRYGPKHEIRHIFNASPKTAPWYICQVFILATIICTFCLLISWMASGSINLQNVPRGSSFFYFVAFIGSVIGFEYIFLKYYSGSSIFETLYSVLYLGIPSLLLGTKFLRNFAEKL